jgi:hypothetical protein
MVAWETFLQVAVARESFKRFNGIADVAGFIMTLSRGGLVDTLNSHAFHDLPLACSRFRPWQATARELSVRQKCHGNANES